MLKVKHFCFFFDLDENFVSFVFSSTVFSERHPARSTVQVAALPRVRSIRKFFLFFFVEFSSRIFRTPKSKSKPWRLSAKFTTNRKKLDETFSSFFFVKEKKTNKNGRIHFDKKQKKKLIDLLAEFVDAE